MDEKKSKSEETKLKGDKIKHMIDVLKPLNNGRWIANSNIYKKNKDLDKEDIFLLAQDKTISSSRYDKEKHQFDKNKSAYYSTGERKEFD